MLELEVSPHKLKSDVTTSTLMKEFWLCYNSYWTCWHQHDETFHWKQSAYLPLDKDGRRRDGIDFDDGGSCLRCSHWWSTIHTHADSRWVGTMHVVMIRIDSDHSELVSAAYSQQQLYVQLPTYADNMALPAFTRRCSSNPSISAANLQQRVCCCGGPCWDKQMNRRTDMVPFHRPCSAYFVGSANNVIYQLPAQMQQQLQEQQQQRQQ